MTPSGPGSDRARTWTEMAGDGSCRRGTRLNQSGLWVMPGFVPAPGAVAGRGWLTPQPQQCFSQQQSSCFRMVISRWGLVSLSHTPEDGRSLAFWWATLDSNQ